MLYSYMYKRYMCHYNIKMKVHSTGRVLNGCLPCSNYNCKLCMHKFILFVVISKVKHRAETETVHVMCTPPDM